MGDSVLSSYHIALRKETQQAPSFFERSCRPFFGILVGHDVLSLFLDGLPYSRSPWMTKRALVETFVKPRIGGKDGECSREKREEGE